MVKTSSDHDNERLASFPSPNRQQQNFNVVNELLCGLEDEDNVNLSNALKQLETNVIDIRDD